MIEHPINRPSFPLFFGLLLSLLVLSTGDACADSRLAVLSGKDYEEVHTVPINHEKIGKMDWEPGGNCIVYSAAASKHWALYLYDTQSEESIQLTRGPFSDRAPAWFQSRSGVAFTSNRDGDSRIYGVDLPVNSQPACLTCGLDLNGYHDFPTVSSDGQTLYFVVFSAGYSASDIWCLDLKTREVQRLVANQDFNVSPSTISDSASLIYISRVNEKEVSWFRKLELPSRRDTVLQLSGEYFPFEILDARCAASAPLMVFTGLHRQREGSLAVQLFVARTNGTNSSIVRTVDSLLEDGYQIQNPALSGDGSKIAVVVTNVPYRSGSVYSYGGKR